LYTFEEKERYRQEKPLLQECWFEHVAYPFVGENSSAGSKQKQCQTKNRWRENLFHWVEKLV
jgi:hypothetical protein